MKQLLSADPLSNTRDMGLLALRIGIGVLMLVHGLPKLEMLVSGDTSQFPSVLGMSADVSLMLTVVSEVLCSFLIIAGLATRLAVIPLIITMLVAVFVIHAGDPFAKQELGIHYLISYAVLLIAGSGKYSVDYLVQRKDIRNYHPEVKPDDPTVAIYQ